jgi:hypothetical protein
MSYLDQLPETVAEMIRTQFVAEYATISQAGVPIDTPTLVHTSEDLTTLDVVTGLSYPAKAERARRNPKVGLLLERAPGDPVISVAGMAAVRDANLQANMERSIAETVLAPYVMAHDYQAVVRQAVFYFTRLFVAIAPVEIRWWPNQAATDGPPHVWRAPAGAVFPQSDPAPPGPASPAPGWPTPHWRTLAEQAIARKGPAHLTLIDAAGFPLPFRVRQVTPNDDGFGLKMPASVPWSEGKATLSFEGLENFVGDVVREGETFRFTAERALPILPLMDPPTQALTPTPEVRARLMERLEYECSRRGQPIPTMPAEPPKPTAGALRRAGAAEAYQFSPEEA